ncbi:MAG: DUF3014 domain-containing protein [Gammaproteobacteria bacterium]|nr:DUF3014 domain-containing protein [Gammaproteobacteria bacterium]
MDPSEPDNTREAGGKDGKREGNRVETMTRHLIAGAAALAILGLGFLAWNALMPRERDTPVFVPVPEPSTPSVIEEGPPPAPPASESEGVPVPALELPPLDDSDDFVRTQVDDCLAALFPEEGPTDILRRVAAILENASRAEVTRGRFSVIETPPGDFRVRKRGNRYFIDDATFRRYDAVVQSLTCVRPERAASLIGLFGPLLAQAMGEFGLPGADIDAMADSALAEILAVEFPGLPIEVVQTNARYRFADAELEAASTLAKQLVRIGPDNLASLQRHARKVRAALKRQVLDPTSSN